MAISPMRRPARAIAAALAAVVALLSVGCLGTSTTDEYTDYGEMGADFATAFVKAVPVRKAFTAEEGKAADFIAAELKDLGYEPYLTDFDEAGAEVERGAGVASSRNLVVVLPGTGFQVVDPDTGESKSERRTVLFCAHYDTALGTADLEAAPGFDGIQDNASGVAALLQVAAVLKGKPHGYDIVLAFYGAGNAGQKGAAFHLASLDAAARRKIDAVYCVESIYAGDKLYADAGWNSTVPGRKYELRKKLYETTDIAIKYKVDLRTNQAGFDYAIPGTETTVVLREVSLNRSDYVPFDEAGIPCVFFESYDFFGRSVEKMAESRNPAFEATKGRIRGTASDSSALLGPLLEKERLQTRINQVAFLLVKVVERGIDEGSAAITPAVLTKAAASPTAAPTATPAK